MSKASFSITDHFERTDLSGSKKDWEWLYPCLPFFLSSISLVSVAFDSKRTTEYLITREDDFITLIRTLMHKNAPRRC